VRRRLFTVASVISLLFSAAIVGLWIKSHSTVYWASYGAHELVAYRGSVFYCYERSRFIEAELVIRHRPVLYGLDDWLDRGRRWCGFTSGVTSGSSVTVWFYGAPLWLVVAIFAIPSVVAFPSRKRPVATCPICGYNLPGSTSRVCPECGMSIPKTPADKGPTSLGDAAKFGTSA